MQSSSEQPLVGEEQCVTTLITAAKETSSSYASVNSSYALPPSPPTGLSPGNLPLFFSYHSKFPGAGTYSDATIKTCSLKFASKLWLFRLKYILKLKKTSTNFSAITPGYANARPPGRAKLAKATPRD